MTSTGREGGLPSRPRREWKTVALAMLADADGADDPWGRAD